MAYYSGRDAKVVHLAQSTFGTQPADNTAGVIKGTSSMDIEYDLNVREADMVTGQRWRVQADTRTDQNEAMPTISEDAVVFRANLAEHLYAHFQQVDEDSTASVFAKTFTYHSTQPDFQSDAGHFETLLLQNPESNTDVTFKDCIVQEIVFSVEPRGELQASIGHNSRGSGSSTNDYTGTTTRASTNTFHFTGMGEHSVNGTAFNPVGPVEITCTQLVTPVGVDSAGDGRFETFLLTDKRATLKAKINFDSVARDLKYNFVNDQPVNIIVGWGTKSTDGATNVGSVAGDLNFSGSAKITSWKEDLSEAYAVDIEAEFYGTSSASPITIILADGVDKSW